MSAMRTVMAVALTAVLLGPGARAHSGGTDANGCHTDHRTGDYHCHDEPVDATTVLIALLVVCVVAGVTVWALWPSSSSHTSSLNEPDPHRTCHRDDHCDRGYVCRGGRCQTECRVNGDCRMNETCHDGGCRAANAASGSGLGISVAPAGAGLEVRW